MADAKNTYIDPLFWVPDDVIDFVQVEDENNLNGVDAYITDLEFEIDSEGIDNGEDEYALEDAPIVDLPSILPVVDNFVVVEQKLRTQPDGTHLVDVTIEVDDYLGVSGYNVRLTRV